MMAMIWRLIIGGLWKPILAALSLIALFFGGRRSAHRDRDLKDAKDFRDTTERMQDAPRPVDADDARKRMRERKP